MRGRVSATTGHMVTWTRPGCVFAGRARRTRWSGGERSENLSMGIWDEFGEGVDTASRRQLARWPPLQQPIADLFHLLATELRPPGDLRDADPDQSRAH